MPKRPKRGKSRPPQVPHAATPTPAEVAAVAAELGISHADAEQMLHDLDATGALDASGRRTWTVGVRPLSVPVEDLEDPALIVWAEGSLIVEAGIIELPTTPEQLAESFQRACLAPQSGSPRTPTCIRAETQELADRLRVFLVEEFDVAHAPPSEVINSMFERLQESFRQAGTQVLEPDGDESERDLGPLFDWLQGQTEATAARLFELSANMQAQRPWERCPPDEGMKVRIKALGIEDGWLTVMGHNGQCFGFQFHRSHAEWTAADKAWDRFQMGAPLDSLTFPPAWSVELMAANAPDPDEMPDILAPVIALNGKAMIPALAVTHGMNMQLVRQRSEMELLLAVTEGALAAMAAEPKAFNRAWSRGGPTYNHTCEVPLERGAVKVEITVPGAVRTATFH